MHTSDKDAYTRWWLCLVVAYRYFRTGDLGMFIKGGFLKVRTASLEPGNQTHGTGLAPHIAVHA